MFWKAFRHVTTGYESSEVKKSRKSSRFHKALREQLWISSIAADQNRIAPEIGCIQLQNFHNYISMY
jgi:hypothetical protein